MLILGKKNKLSKDDKNLLQSKFETIHEIDIANDTTESIISKITSFVKKEKVKHIVLNLDKTLSIELESYLEDLDYSGVQFMTYSDFSSKYLNKCHIEFNDKNFKVLQDIKHDSAKQFGKRVFDIVFSLFAIILLSPVYIVVALLIKIKSPGAPVIFAHKRIGKDGKFFRVYKFRTMVANAEQILEDWLENHPDIKEEYEKDFKLKEDPRIIPGIGEKMRKYSIDELPQFFNSLFGNMSIVGPRPIVEKEVGKYGKYAIKLYSVKPGVTGLWQVSGRNDIDYNERVAIDMEYIDNQTFWGDIKIIIQTVLVMVFKKGAY
ncbi:sugar transferase [Aliarcobacter cryaerophilus]|uniref:sugar transferase n=1 Tax=Aliarcobacter cryaerophilus TaxID=28198 RepID=UPI003DA54467